MPVEDLSRGSRQNFPIVIAHSPASRRERRFALGVIIFLLVIFGIAAPFATMPLARVYEFIPTLQTALCIADLVTAALLFAQYSVQPAHGVLALASGYMFSGLFAFLQTLTFPGAYGPAGLIGDPLSSAGYLFCLWHVAFPIGVIVYALSKDASEVASLSGRSTGFTIGVTIACVLAVIAALTWAVTARAEYLPKIFINATQQAPFASYLTGSIWLLSAAALGLLMVRKRTSLAVWLMVTLFATLPDLALSTVMSSVRFTLGWYVARSYALIASCTVLIALITETTVLYSRLASTMALQRRERSARLMSVVAATSAMAHEIKQPLAAITTRTAAARRWLERAPPDLDRAKQLLGDIDRATFHADEVLANVRMLFRDADHKQQSIDLNKLVFETLQILDGELNDHNVKTEVELTSELPLVRGHEIQLQEVILNLVRNAIDAMAHTKVDRRVLTVRTRPEEAKAIVIEIQDSGQGIEAERLGNIFEAFVTTKPHGTGLGLAICSTIIEQHGGHLTASSDGKNGALFKIVLPVEPMDKAAGRAQ